MSIRQKFVDSQPIPGISEYVGPVIFSEKRFAAPHRDMRHKKPERKI